MDLASRDLYGGAMSMAVPSGMVDVSNFRTVPDNQEVFADDNDCSVIVEILESVSAQKHDALRYHFAQIAELNDADSAQQAHVEDIQLDAAGEAYVLVGQQDVAKFNEQASNKVCMMLALLRVPEHNADILVSMNSPLAIDPASSSSNRDCASAPMLQASVEDQFVQFKQMVRTLRVNDVGLFA